MLGEAEYTSLLYVVVGPYVVVTIVVAMPPEPKLAGGGAMFPEASIKLPVVDTTSLEVAYVLCVLLMVLLVIYGFE